MQIENTSSNWQGIVLLCTEMGIYHQKKLSRPKLVDLGCWNQNISQGFCIFISQGETKALFRTN